MMSLPAARLLFVTLMLQGALTGCSKWTRVGDLDMVSTRHVDTSVTHVELATYESAIVRGSDRGLQDALDKVIRGVEGGQFATNVSVSMKRKGKKFKVQGDVWGVRPSAAVVSAAPLEATQQAPSGSSWNDLVKEPAPDAEADGFDAPG
jgi:hypothetical protein